MLLEEIHKLKRTFALLLLGSIFLIAPGALTIFLFDRALFEALDVTKLCLLSASLIAPFTVLVGSIIYDPKSSVGDDGDDDGFFASIILGTLVSGSAWYIPLFASYILHWHFSMFIWPALILEFVAAFLVYLMEKKDQK